MMVFIFSTLLLCGCKKDEKKPTDLEIIKNRGYIIVGVKEDSYPFGFKDDKNTRKGIDIEIAKEIAKEIFNTESEYGKIEFVDVNAQNRISKLNSKEVDILVATMSVNEKRKMVIDFSMPYFVTSQKIMTKPTSKISHLNYFNKNGKLCIVLGTTGEKIARRLAPNANVVGAKTYKEAFNYLKSGKVDAILGDDCILSGLKNLHNENFRIVNRSYSSEYYAVAIRKSINSKDLLNAVNTALVEILDNKEINTIKAYYKIK